METKTIDIVFDGMPGPEGPRFVEVERGGTSISIGEWVKRDDGLRALRIPDPEQVDVNQLVALLQTIVRNDETRFEHHQPRRWDGKVPSDVGSGSIWLTPREVARSALKRLGAPLPDAILESLNGG